jgi:hypothetical protein
MEYSVNDVRRLWVQGLHVRDIAKQLNVTSAVIYRLKTVHKFPRRQRVCLREGKDPTPQEIQQRAAEIRARHLERLRSEDSVATTNRLSHEKRRAGTACHGL